MTTGCYEFPLFKLFTLFTHEERLDIMGKVSVWKIVIKVIIAMATTLLGALGTKGEDNDQKN